MDHTALMQNLGLTEIEARVYVELLKLGSTTTGPLVRKTELHRATVYDVLKRLMEKGLVSYITRQNTKYFQSVDPERFLDFLQEEEEQFQHKKEETKKLIGELDQLKKTTLQKQQANLFVGKKAIRAMYEKIMRHKEVWTFGSHGRFKKVMGSYFQQFQQRKKRLGIKTRLLLSERVRGTDLADPRYAEVHYLQKNYDSPTATHIFGDYVAIIVWEETPIGFLIESKDTANAFRNYYQIIWEVAKP